MKQLTVLGAGSWGTALSIVLAPRFETVRLWVHESELAAQMTVTRENGLYLPGFPLPENVQPTPDLQAASANAAVVLGVVPSHHLRHVFTQALPYLSPQTSFVSATKGIENDSLMRMSEVIRSVIPLRNEPNIAVLSGPTFAKEVAAGQPTAVVIASEDEEFAALIQAAFSGPTFRLYTNTDPIGVELGAALKNVIAIGAGICQGLGLGSNTVAALITRGLAEISRLAVAMGGDPRTLSGLAGLGDLVLTCNGELSRNRKVGIGLAEGLTLEEILGGTKMVAEGVETTYAAVDLSKRYGIEMPITEQMYGVLRAGRSPQDAIRELMERSLKRE
ncbi:MAG: NAD(P)H-dependent glycerol-3-phosphate dehydrogenase [Bryobacteraceae bacterium]